MKTIRKWPGALAVVAAATMFLGVPVYELATLGPSARPVVRSSINTTAARGGHRLGNDPTVNDDDIITVRARGFAANEPVELGLGSEPSFDRVVIAGRDGTLRYPLTVPDGASGEDVLTFTGLGPAANRPASPAGANIEASVPKLAAFYFTVHG